VINWLRQLETNSKVSDTLSVSKYQQTTHRGETRQEKVSLILRSALEQFASHRPFISDFQIISVLIAFTQTVNEFAPFIRSYFHSKTIGW
jgi:hypothetical protein